MRERWRQIHRWLGLTLGLALGFVALLGAALIVAKPLDQWAHPEFFQARAVGPASAQPLEDARLALTQEFGATARLTFRPPREADESLRAIVRGPWSGTVYLDPASGRELGRRGEAEGLYNLMFELHSSLLADDTGKALLALLALGYLLLLVCGLVLWWPGRLAWRIELRRGARRAVYDLHRVGGAALGLLLAVSVVSGAYMAWKPLAAAVTTLAGAQKTVAPALGAQAVGSRAPLDEVVRRAQAALPQGMVGYVHLEASAQQPIRVRLKLPQDPHPNGLSSVWLHPLSAQVLRVDRVDQLDPGSRAYSVIYPLHAGELGGTAHAVLNALLGLALAGLAGSGAWQWWQRRARRRAQVASVQA